MTETGILGLSVHPIRRWFTEEQCETAVRSALPGAGAVTLGLTGFAISPFPFSGALALASLGAGAGGLGAKKVINRGFCKVCKSK